MALYETTTVLLSVTNQLSALLLSSEDEEDAADHHQEGDDEADQGLQIPGVNNSSIEVLSPDGHIGCTLRQATRCFRLEHADADADEDECGEAHEHEQEDRLGVRRLLATTTCRSRRGCGGMRVTHFTLLVAVRVDREQSVPPR